MNLLLTVDYVISELCGQMNFVDKMTECPEHPDGLRIASALAIAIYSAPACLVGQWIVDKINRKRDKR